MLEPAKYAAVEALRDGRPVEIRALKPDDREGVLAAAGRASPRSLFLRFFVAKREFTDREMAFFTNVDFRSHVALVATVKEREKSAIVGGGRYIVIRPGAAEVAFAVIDQYQGQGIGTALLRHLVVIARDAELQELIAEVLPENTSMLTVLQKCGLPLARKCESRVVHLTLKLG
jgi:RimJ/RimL family protein N-acetyltransferase